MRLELLQLSFSPTYALLRYHCALYGYERVRCNLWTSLVLGSRSQPRIQLPTRAWFFGQIDLRALRKICLGEPDLGRTRATPCMQLALPMEDRAQERLLVPSSQKKRGWMSRHPDQYATLDISGGGWGWGSSSAAGLDGRGRQLQTNKTPPPNLEPTRALSFSPPGRINPPTKFCSAVDPEVWRSSNKALAIASSAHQLVIFSDISACRRDPALPSPVGGLSPTVLVSVHWTLKSPDQASWQHQHPAFAVSDHFNRRHVVGRNRCQCHRAGRRGGGEE